MDMHYLIAGIGCEFSFSIQTVISDTVLPGFCLQEKIENAFPQCEKLSSFLGSGLVVQTAQAPSHCKGKVRGLHGFGLAIIRARYEWLANKTPEESENLRVQREQRDCMLLY